MLAFPCGERQRPLLDLDRRQTFAHGGRRPALGLLQEQGRAPAR
ncbi:MAG TPA: hypothetical protein VFD49_14645 [Candidatus Dormibacteraeota bacterium]|nr:hypothetical protein [Candidatus Dormibacteraeota bacterium]